MSDEAGLFADLGGAASDVAGGAGDAAQGLSSGGIDLANAGVGQAIAGAGGGLASGAFDLASAPLVDNAVNGFSAVGDLGGGIGGFADAVSPIASAAQLAKGAGDVGGLSGGGGVPTSAFSGGSLQGNNPSSIAAAVADTSNKASPAAGAGSITSPLATGGLGGGAAGAAPNSIAIDPTGSGLVTDTPLDGSNLSGGGTLIDPGNGAGGFQDAGSGAAGAAKPGASSLMNAIHDPSFDSIGGALEKNAGLLAAGGGLAYNALSGGGAGNAVAGQKQFSQQADQLAAQGTQLASYLQTGTLPPGVSAGIKSAGEAAKATIRSRYAASGSSGSSAEAQDLAAVDQQLVTQGSNIAMNMLQTGINESQIASHLYETIMNNAMAEDESLGKAISSFASAAAGNTRPLVIQQSAAS